MRAFKRGERYQPPPQPSADGGIMFHLEKETSHD
jgi:hypothetical protein